ncbi:MAG TPA: ABC transporter permease [Bryobacteraceae bacterium]|jgi:predicted permease|nr:ABC transporter permease [Bryobacteraceae bacterium]
MRSILQDFRYGLRGLRKQPSFAALAVLALALGIGAATTIFSVIDNVLLDPFPYTNAERFVTFQIHDVKETGQGGRSFFKLPEFLEYQNQSHVFEEVIGSGVEFALITTPEGVEHFQGSYVSPNMFAVLGVPALLGRGIVPDDAKPGAPPVFVMAYKMWKKRYNLDASVLGQSFIVNGVPTTLVGIMPPRFTKRAADLWSATPMDPADARNKDRYFQFQARMKPGVTLHQVDADIDVIARRLAQVYPQQYPKQFTIQTQTWLDSLVGPFRKTLYTLAAAVGLLLLIACGNVANMLLARATAREKEMAVRASLGAARWRLVRQLLAESLLLALGGAALGWLFSYAGIQAIVALIPDGAIPHEVVIRLNVPVLLFSLGVACLTALLFGLAPALQISNQDFVEPLKDSGKGVSGGFRRGKLRNTLVVVEVALSMVLLVGAGLLMRSFVRLETVDLGFNPDNILVTFLPLSKGQYKTAESKHHFFSQLLPRLQGLPGVLAATESTGLPPYGGIGTEIEIPGKTHQERWEAIYQLVGETYCPTLGIRLLRGRNLNETEVNGARKVAVVNQTLVKKFFGQEDPIGRQIKLTTLGSLTEGAVPNPFFEIVGVMADARNQGVQDPPMPEILVPYTVTAAFDRGILVRTSGDPMRLANAVRREVWALDRNIALAYTDTLSNYLMQFTYAAPRFSFILLVVFAGVGLVLVAIGVYSVIAYTVTRQTHEIGIRMALGAGDTDVFRMVLAMGLRLIGIGVAAGLLVSFAVTRVIASQLWGVSPYDPMTIGSVVGVVGVVGLAACYFPARRATRVHPLIALRYE